MLSIPHRQVTEYRSCFESQVRTCDASDLADLSTELERLVALTVADCSDACTNYPCHNGGICVINDDDEPECECFIDIYIGDHCDESMNSEH